MHVYLLTGQSKFPAMQSIMKTMYDHSIHFSYRQGKKEKFYLSNDVMQRIHNEGSSLFEKTDALIIDITLDTDATGFLLSKSVMTKKPLLCLYQKKSHPQKYLLTALQKKQTSSPITLKEYSTQNITHIITNFLEKLKLPSHV